MCNAVKDLGPKPGKIDNSRCRDFGNFLKFVHVDDVSFSGDD